MIRGVEERADSLGLLASAAGDLPIPEASDLDGAVRSAMLAAQSRRARRRRNRWTMAVLSMSCGLGLLGVGLYVNGSSQAPFVAQEAVDRPEVAVLPTLMNRLELPTGDRIVRAGDGDLSVEALGPDRRFVLHEGEALFDVAPLRASESFRVRTPDASIEVVGTIFALQVDDGHTRVQVFEGRVRVRLRSGEERLLDRGESFDARSPSSSWRSSLEAEGHAAVERRVASPPASVSPPAVPAVERSALEVPLEVAALEVAALEVAALEVAALEVPGLARVRGWLEEGDSRALAAAHAGVARNPQSGAWLLLVGDALRRHTDPGGAADAYDRAVDHLPASRATQAGYLAAELRLRGGDAVGALRSLDAARSSDEGSPIEERAFALRVRAEVASGRMDAARTGARRYLVRYPSGAARDWMLRLAEP